MAWGKPDKNGKREPMGARTSYMRELCFERLAKKSKHNVSSASMKWGHTEEQKAQDAYEMLTGNIAIPSEFIVHPKYDWLDCSPDGSTMTVAPSRSALSTRRYTSGLGSKACPRNTCLRFRAACSLRDGNGGTSCRSILAKMKSVSSTSRRFNATKTTSPTCTKSWSSSTWN
nr:YqaJ viral recombinase family protein [Pseudomonas frederiksbergensis]